VRRFTLGSTLLLLSAAVLVEPCFGQFGPPSPFGGSNYQSPLSPYSNLFLGRSNAVNYFSATAPFTQSLTGTRGFAPGMFPGQDTAMLRRLNLEGPDDYVPELPQTGHVVRFMTYGPYYNLGGSQAQRSNILYPYRQAQVKTK
jgi:hypothetical protein